MYGNNLGELGYQAAQRIIKGANPLKLMKDLSQNFPNHAVALSRVKVNDTLKSELQNSRLLPEGDSLALINGRVIHLETITPFEYPSFLTTSHFFRLYSILQEESFKLNSLLTLKISKTDAFKVLSTAADKSPVNTFKIPTDAPIVYLNDLENDPQYQGWPRSVSEVNKVPTFPTYSHSCFVECGLDLSVTLPRICSHLLLLLMWENRDRTRLYLC